MTTANLRLDEQPTRNLARPGIEADTSTPDAEINPTLIPVSKARRLDVDAVLARSLAKVVEE